MDINVTNHDHFVVVFFKDGIMGWLMHVKPEWFGIRIEEKEAKSEAGA